jgi:pyruvate ferredoxin oxidoreductase alpha subunit
MTATSANGLALMWEIVYIAASTRLPIVMALVNRALSAPINIHCDHSDLYGVRDSGWIQIVAENAQEAYDNLIMAVKLAERKDVLLPVMVNIDGFFVSHAIEDIEVLDDSAVKEFVGEFNSVEYPLLNVDKPVTYGPLDLWDYYMEHKVQQVDAMSRVIPAFKEVAKEYEKISGRGYRVVEPYKMEDAETCIVGLGSSMGGVKEVVDEFRAKGEKVGCVCLRLFRPFPAKELVETLSHAKGIAVLDRAFSFGSFGNPLFVEVSNALYHLLDRKIPVLNYVYGLGGRPLMPSDVREVVEDLKNLKEGRYHGEILKTLGVRE